MELIKMSIESNIIPGTTIKVFRCFNEKITTKWFILEIQAKNEFLKLLK